MKRFVKILVVAVVTTLCASLFMAVPVSAAPPSITGVSITPDPAYTDTDLVAVPEGWSDPDLDPEGYQWQWQIWDGVSAFVDITGETTDTLASTNFVAGDEIQVLCTPYDGSETGTQMSDTIIISGGIVTITPDPAYTDTDLLATPEHWTGSETFTYQWQIWDGVSAFVDITGETTDTLASTNFVAGDEINVVCTPYIDAVAGDSVEASIIISNSVPSITGVTITPDPAYTNSLLEAIPAGWSDADGDPEGYQWQWQKYDDVALDFLDITGATTDSLDNTNFTLGDEIKVICTPFDGIDTGESMDATTTIVAFNYDAGVDVKPGSDVNPINLKSRGVIPVAIYTTEGFDATMVDVATVVFGPNEASPVHFGYEDVDQDGDIDLILHFRTQSVGISADDTEVTLAGVAGGMAFTGTNTIKIVPAHNHESVQGNEAAPGQNKEPGESVEGKANGKDSAPGQNKEPGESAEGKANGKDSAPGQNKEPGESAEGKAKGKNK